MKYSVATVVAFAVLCAGAAQGAEVRSTVGLATGEVKYDGNGFAVNDVTADTQSLSFAVEYYFEDAGPFAGVGIGRVRADGSGERFYSTNTSVGMGYRGGSRGSVQPFAAVALTRSSAEGESSSAAGLYAGVERTSETGRVSVQVSYNDEEDFDTYGASVTGVAFLSESLGVFATAGMSRGDGDIGIVDVDVSTWTIGFGVEFRH